jgi:hypothetical protein
VEPQKTFGVIPNIVGAMAESPELISGFIGVFQKVHSGDPRSRDPDAAAHQRGATGALGRPHSVLPLR